MKILLIFICLVASSFGNESPFVGKWNVVPEYLADEEGVLAIPEERHPIWMHIKSCEKSGKLSILVKDRSNNLIEASSVQVLNKGREILFTIGSHTGEYNTLISLQRAIIKDGKLKGVTVNKYPILAWTGEKEGHKSNPVGESKPTKSE